MLYDGTLMNKEEFKKHVWRLDQARFYRNIQLEHKENKEQMALRREKELPVEDEDNQEEDKE